MKGQFAQFVKEHYASVKDLPAKERMKKLAEKYKMAGHTKPVMQKERVRERVRGGAVSSPVMQKEKEYKLPLSLVPPSVGVDRRYKKSTSVPGAFYSGGPNYNPHEQAIEEMRKGEPELKQEQGAFIRQGPSGKDKEGTDLKQMLKMFGVSAPKFMRNVPQGGKLTKKHLEKIYKHTIATHGERGAGLFDDMWRGFSQGFTLPFKAVGSVANAMM